MNGMEMRQCRLALAMVTPLMVAPGLRAEPAEVVWTRSAEGCLVANPQPRVNDGVQWSGLCPEGKAGGEGTLRWSRNGVLWSIYTGQLKDGIAIGPGRFTWDSGARYVGDLVNGLPQGRGVKTDADGSTYTGDFVNGKREGQGEWVSRWGARYVGEFRNDLYHGQGTLHASSGYLREGQWVAGRLEGPGTVKLVNGDQYSGGFVSDLMSGEGDYRWSNGDSYRGHFELNQPFGSGRYLFANGAEFVGEFRKGRPRGFGTLIRADGKRIAGIFESVPSVVTRISPLHESPTDPQPQIYQVGAEVVVLNFSSVESVPPRPVRAYKLEKPFCTRMGSPEVPSVNWVGIAHLRLVAQVKDGRVTILDIVPVLTPANFKAESRFIAAVRKAVAETYECSGEHVFEQEFNFSVQ